MFKRSALLFAAAGCVLAGLSACVPAEVRDTRDIKEVVMDPMLRAPDFPKEFAWLNTDQPLSFKTNLKGQVVLIDFWTYCCINCIHILPDLAYLEEKYKDQPFVVLGVHSSKFDNESDPANIRAAIQRYEIHHPVLVDQEHRVWDTYDVRSWPTLVLVGADGKIIGAISGEGHREALDQHIARALRDAKTNGTLAAAPLKLAREGQIRAASGLAFPAKVIVDAGGAKGEKRLFIVDSNHNRIVVTSYPGDDGHVKVLQTIGTGKAGAEDGGFAAASFNRPQGGTLTGNALWIADTENHLIRRVDLEKQTVTTVLGTGRQDFDPEAGKTGRLQGLNSPWDVAVGGNRLYIAQAGQHQIFGMNLMTGMTEVVAGSARENIRDGEARAANLAQPSGLAFDSRNQVLYFADSEVSAIRALDTRAGRVSTLVGKGLFDFGDVDGSLPTALLQHPLGVALTADGTRLLVADTYNHKVKMIDLASRRISTLAGNGKPGTGGAGSGGVQFFEPASIAVANAAEAFVADTNNHRIIRFNPETRVWKELVIDGLASPGGSAEMVVDKDALDVGPKTLAAGKAIEVKATLKLPLGNHLTEGAPLSLKVTDGKRVLYSATLSPPARRTATPVLSATVPADVLAAKPSELYVMLYYTHCSEGISAVCVPAKAAWKFGVGFEGDAALVELGK